jgi:alginate O-acetyltransferase complex protein AlgI
MCAWLKQSVPTYASWYRGGNVLFNTLSYLVFLLVIVIAYWALPRGWRVWLVFGASLLFYALWRWEFVFLISFSAFVDYFFSLRIHALAHARRRRWLMIASVSINLGLLLYFKYTYFILDNVAEVGANAGQDWRFDPGNIVLPLGISFYTFLSISYTIDVYRRLFEPVRHFPTYLAYVLFWPHMIAGPILRAHELLP